MSTRSSRRAHTRRPCVERAFTSSWQTSGSCPGAVLHPAIASSSSADRRCRCPCLAARFALPLPFPASSCALFVHPPASRFSCTARPGRARKRHGPVAAGGRVAFKRQSTSKHRRSEDRDHHQRNHATHRWTGVDAQRPTAATEPRSELDGEDCGGQTEENNLPLSRGKSANRMLGAAGPRYFVFQAFGYLIASDSGRRFAVVDTNLSTRHMHHQGFITHDHDSLPTPPPQTGSA